MKRVLLAVGLALCAVAPAGAHPGHGPIAVSVDGDFRRFTPPEVTIGVNDSVVWFWSGTVSRDHSVTADPGQAESFDSDPNGLPTNETHPEGDYFSHTFRTPGAYTYHCSVHPEMTGVVNVVPLPTSTALHVNAFRVVGRDDSIHTRFFASHKVAAVFRITRWHKPKWELVKTLNRTGKKGRNEFDFPARSLKPGLYRLRLTAYDAQNQRVSIQAPFELSG